MFLIAGLGNPGVKYAGHRHNVGFMVADALADRCAAAGFRDKFEGQFVKAHAGQDDVVILKPMTFMNLSGQSVQAAMRFFKVPVERLLVVHDELDLPFGELRLKNGGGTAGHNGLKSIVAHAGGNGFLRLRVGVGRPAHGRADSHVLSDFNAEERERLADVTGAAVDFVLDVLSLGPIDAMNRHHAP